MTRAQSSVACLVAIAITVFAAASLIAQEATGAATSVVGTWIGDTEVPGQGTDHITIAFTKTEKGLAGTIADSLGMIAGAAEIKDLKIVKNEITGAFSLADGGVVAVKLTLDGDTLKGSWTHESGDTGDLTLARKKQ